MPPGVSPAAFLLNSSPHEFARSCSYGYAVMFLMRLFEAELSKATCFPKHNKNPRQVTAEGFELHQVG